MMRALSTAATGMQAQQLNVDTIANNLANVNTAAFKKTSVRFQDLLYQDLRPAGDPARLGPPSELAIGHGTKLAATERAFQQGTTEQTDNPLNLAIEGDGFFQVRRTDGTIGYTRDGAFFVSADGMLVNSDGLYVEPAIQVPDDARQLFISQDGLVSVNFIDSNDTEDIGQIELVRFLNPAGLSALGRNQYQQTPASGAPIAGTPGSAGIGGVLQGFLEGSNVEVVDEMVSLITAQRAYEINSKAIQTADSMLSQATQLVR
ncbi:MAG: flagellar basal-body rod protein FlgG [Gemmatimonadetes bacterium]|nr:flagellar basal-body rod protein FlgG [Gemmatimonadota bacterium]